MSQELFNIREWQTAWFAKALSEDRFETWYQPIVDTSSRSVVGHECLIRLRTAGFGQHTGEIEGRTYTGFEILDAARARNDIRAFDCHARTLAVRSAALQRHLDQRNPTSRGPFFVNFLPAAIDDPEEAMRPVMETLEATGLRPADFVFEVVEADLVGESGRLRRIQNYIRERGFGFALDNVGIGPNPLQSLSDLRPDYIKIDQRVSWNIEQPIYAATVRMLVEVADRMDVKVIACGIERIRTVENLWLLGVQIMQGYLFGRPSPDLVRSAEADPLEAATPESDLANLSQALCASNPVREPVYPFLYERQAEAESHQDIFLIHSNTGRRM